MKTDLYTKIMLTLIAIGLWGVLLKPIFITEPVIASNGITDVNIEKIGGLSIDKRTLLTSGRSGASTLRVLTCL